MDRDGLILALTFGSCLIIVGCHHLTRVGFVTCLSLSVGGEEFLPNQDRAGKVVPRMDGWASRLEADDLGKLPTDD